MLMQHLRCFYGFWFGFQPLPVRCLVCTTGVKDDRGFSTYAVSMLLYMDRVVRGQRKIERDYFTLAALTTNHIKEREKEEMKFGIFGDGFVDNAMEEVIALESNNIDVSPPSSQKNDLKGYILDLASTMKTVAESHIILESKLLKGASLFANNETVKKLRVSALRLVNEVIEEQDTKDGADLSPVDGTKGGNEFDEFYDDEICNHPSVLAALRLADMVSKNKNPSQISPSQNDKIPYASQKEYVQDYAFCAKRIADDMMALDDKIKLGETIFPNNEVVKKLHSSTTLLYQTYDRHEGEKIQPDFSFDSEDFQAELLAATMAAERAYTKKLIFEKLRKRYKEPGSPKWGPISFSLGLSQDDVVTQQNSRHEGDIIDDEGSKSSGDGGAEDEGVVDNPKKTDPPFFDSDASLREDTDPSRQLIALQLCVSDYLFIEYVIGSKENKEVVFEYGCVVGYRSDFSTLKPSKHLSNFLIDCWAACLNISERKHKFEKKCKFFCSTLGYLMLAKKNNFKSFKNIMKNELEAFGFSDLKSIKMFFFPTIHEDHYFLHVFDLENKNFLIIDNWLHKGKVEDQYGEHSGSLSGALATFLNGYDETRAISSELVYWEPSILKMSWRNNHNVDDCGVYLMRHIETFTGEKKWSCALKKKNMEPLKTLRAKYVCSMISMEENVHGKRVIDQARKHHEQKTKELESTGS